MLVGLIIKLEEHKWWRLCLISEFSLNSPMFKLLGIIDWLNYEPLFWLFFQPSSAPFLFHFMLYLDKGRINWSFVVHILLIGDISCFSSIFAGIARKEGLTSRISVKNGNLMKPWGPRIAQRKVAGDARPLHTATQTCIEGRRGAQLGHDRAFQPCLFIWMHGCPCVEARPCIVLSFRSFN